MTNARRVVILVLGGHPPRRVIGYVRYLASRGVGVDLVVASNSKVHDLDVDEQVRVHVVLDIGAHDRLLRLEQLLVYRIPGGVLAKARRSASGRRWASRLDALLESAERVHGRVARAFHRRIFLPAYRSLRVLWLAGRFNRSLRPLDIAGADRVVAADRTAIPLGWRLARRYRDVVATTALDRTPYELGPAEQSTPAVPPGTAGRIVAQEPQVSAYGPIQQQPDNPFGDPAVTVPSSGRATR